MKLHLHRLHHLRRPQRQQVDGIRLLSLDIPTKSNRVDIGVRVELPADDILPPHR